MRITRNENVFTKGEDFDYTQVSEAKVEEVIKGTLPENVKILGGETLRNGAVQFPRGRYLVFLRRKGEFLVGSHAGQSARPIDEKGQVLWHAPGKPRENTFQPLEEVVSRIRKLLATTIVAP